MAESDSGASDEELENAVKNGTMREGYAHVHHKLFPKYGFLIPEEPLFIGETIFFGITAHVDASKRYIADLRDELKPDQRVQYMAVPQDREGVIKWKGMVVSPLASSLQYGSSQSQEESIEENKLWLPCKVLPNLQPHRGFATPEGGNQYSDNVYFTTREASDGLGVPVSDLRLFFKPGEIVRALVVHADPRYKAKFRALKISKVHPGSDWAINNPSLQIEERDKVAVSWIYSVLKSKGSVKISKLVGNLSNREEVRAVIQPKKRSVKKFLSKYPKFFCIKDNVAMLDPSFPSSTFDMKTDRFLRSIDEKDWSGSSDTDDSTSEDEYTRGSTPSPVQFSSENLKAVAQVSSKFTVSMLASIVKSLPGPVKMLEIFRICEQRGWEGMVSVAMIAQVVTNNPKYFALDGKGCIILTREGSKLSVQRVAGSSKVDEEKLPSSGLELMDGSQRHTPRVLPLPGAPLSDFDPNQPLTYHYKNTSIFSPIENNPPGSFQPFESLSSSLSSKAYPTTSYASIPGGNGDDDFGNGNVYHSDAEDSFEEKQKNPNSIRSSEFSEEESRFLRVVAQAIFPKSTSGAEDVFAMLKKELDNLGITQSDSDGDRLSGVLASHLLCMQMDVDMKPKAIFKHFTPSGKITQSRVTLPAEKFTSSSFNAMLNEKPTNLVSHEGKRLYGIRKTYHCIRVLESELDTRLGCTLSYRSQVEGAVGTPDIDLGDKKKVKILLTNCNGSNSSINACKTLKEYAQEKCAKSDVTVIDMEGQIFGFGLAMPSVKRIICSSVDSQQHYLKEVVHHHTNVVIVNSIDCDDSLKLLQRINAKGIAVYAEVAKSLEINIRKIFDARY